MDIRDILKSFDSLSEAKTTTDKGVTTHKGDYGREFDTDEEGNAVVKKVKSTEPKPKGRRPDPDRPKLGKDDPKNKKVGDLFGRTTGAVPKGKKGTTISGKAQSHSDNKKDDGTGDEEPTSKKSLKEYFDQMDEALYEAALAVQPLPATPQQKQQQQMATKPSFMIKDPANPNMPAITTQDPAVVQAAKNGTMSMQKPGAAPTAPGATPAAGAGSQVKPMEEDGENWIQGAIKHPGAFTKKASSHGMTPKEFANKVLAHKKDYPDKTEKQAQLAKTLGKMHEAEAPQHFAQSSPLSSNNRGVLEGKKGVNPFAKKDESDKKKLPSMSHIKKMCQDGKSLAEICKMHPDCDRAELKKMVADCKKKLSEGVAEGKTIASGLNDWQKKALKHDTYEKYVLHCNRYDYPHMDKRAWQRYKNAFDNMGTQGIEEGSMPMKKVDGKSVPAFAADGKGKNDLTKKSDIDSKRKSQVAAAGKAFNDADEYKKSGGSSKKKVKEGMEHHLQAARLEGKSHALRKMPYNCTHDDMEEARCYHDGFKEGLDECYGQMPILGRTAVDEVSPEVGTMASYGAHDEMDEGNAFTAGLAKTPHGSKFKVGGSTFTDRTRYDSNLDEFAFESLDKQLNAILENKEVSEGMTVSISKGQQGAPDSVSVSAQDGEADQLLSIIKSAGMGLFGGDEQNGYGAPQGGTGAHGGINVVDDHDGMMALMRKLSGGADTSSGDFADEEGSEEEHMHGEEGHSHEGEEGHSHEGEEDSCNECGYMESQCQCDHGDGQQVVDEVESEDQMEFEVAENAPDSGADNTNADVAGNASANSALATADAGDDEEEGEVYSSPTNEAEDETGQLDEISQELAVKTLGLRRAHGMDGWGDDDAHRKADATEKRVEKKFGKDAVAAADKITDKELYGDRKMKEETMSESSFFNLFRKISMLSEESTSEKDDKAEKAGEEVKKDIEYDDKKDKKEKKLDEWANEAGKNGTDAAFEADIDFMTKVISGGLNKQKSTGQTTIPVIAGQKNRMGVDGLGSPMKESNDLLKDYMKLSGL